MVRFGLAGTGRITDWVLKGAVQDPRFKAVAVCSRSVEAAMAFIDSHAEVFPDGASVFTSIEEMAACPDIDAVYVGTPNRTHHRYTMASLEAGKHVLCEKPLACNEAEVREMVEASRRNGRALMEAMISTLNPNFRAAAAKLQEIGPVRQYFSTFCQYSSKYEALKRGIVANSFNPQMGGGALEDIGIYTTFPLVALFGEPDGVKSTLHTMPSDCGEVELGGMVTLSYRNGMTAALAYSKAVDAHLPTEICGENGNIVLDAIHIARKAELLPHAAPSSGRGAGAERITLSEGHPMDDYFYEFREFIDVVESGAVESSVNSHAISLANRSLMDRITSPDCRE